MTMDVDHPKPSGRVNRRRTRNRADRPRGAATATDKRVSLNRPTFALIEGLPYKVKEVEVKSYLAGLSCPAATIDILQDEKRQTVTCKVAYKNEALALKLFKTLNNATFTDKNGKTRTIMVTLPRTPDEVETTSSLQGISLPSNAATGKQGKKNNNNSQQGAKKSVPVSAGRAKNQPKEPKKKKVLSVEKLDEDMADYFNQPSQPVDQPMQQ